MSGRTTTLVLEMEPGVTVVQLGRVAQAASAYGLRFMADLPRRTITLAGPAPTVRLMAGALYGNAITTSVTPRPTGWAAHTGAVA